MTSTTPTADVHGSSYGRGRSSSANSGIRRFVRRWYVSYRETPPSRASKPISLLAAGLARNDRRSSPPTVTVARGSARRLWTHAGLRTEPPQDAVITSAPSAISNAYSVTVRGFPVSRPVVVSRTCISPKASA